MSEYSERQNYERLLKSEPSIVKLNLSRILKSELPKLSTLSEPTIVKSIVYRESKRTLIKADFISS